MSCRSYAEPAGAARPKRPAVVSFRQIIIAPKPTVAAKATARAKIDSLRQELVSGADFATVNADQIEWQLQRVGGILLIIGVLHGLNIVLMPVLGRLFSLNRRLSGSHER